MAANQWSDEQIVEWIAIITIFLFVSRPQEMIYISETSLGKLFFVFVIAYFAMVDATYGMLACGLVIFYYQLDLHRSYVSLHRDVILNESMMAMQDSIIQQGVLSHAPMYSEVRGAIEAYVSGEPNVYSYKPCDESEQRATGLGEGSAASLLEHKISKGHRRNELLNYFRKDNCSEKGVLMYKGSEVRPEMADHVFREIKFANNSAKCNPCNASCEFSIVEDRISKEDALVRPKDSNSEPIDWNKFFGHYLVKPVEEIVGDIQHFGDTAKGFSKSLF
jgi:hypothetical protein